LSDARDAGPHGAGAGPETARERPERLVRRAIAVIVDPVADFGRGRARYAGRARPLDAVRHGHAAATHTAARAPQSLVDGAVAVVVDAVADLGGREDGLPAVQTAVDAHRGTGRARAETIIGHAGLTAAGVAFIDRSVTIVVQTVADLERTRMDAEDLIVAVGKDARTGRRAQREPVVIEVERRIDSGAVDRHLQGADDLDRGPFRRALEARRIGVDVQDRLH